MVIMDSKLKDYMWSAELLNNAGLITHLENFFKQTTNLRTEGIVNDLWLVIIIIQKDYYVRT